MRFVRVIPVISIVAIGIGVTSLSGCEQTAPEAAAVSAALAGDTTPLDQIAREGAIDCPIICVSHVAKDAKEHAGRVAVRGVVSKVFPDRRAFTVANIVEGASCCASGCGHETMPARVPADDFEGELPKEFDRVVIVGEVIMIGDGYNFVIDEVWSKGEVVLKRRG